MSELRSLRGWVASALSDGLVDHRWPIADVLDEIDRRIAVEAESVEARVDLLAHGLENAYRAGRANSDEEVSARDLLAQLDGMRDVAGELL